MSAESAPFLHRSPSARASCGAWIRAVGGRRSPCAWLVLAGALASAGCGPSLEEKCVEACELSSRCGAVPERDCAGGCEANADPDQPCADELEELYDCVIPVYEEGAASCLDDLAVQCEGAIEAFGRCRDAG